MRWIVWILGSIGIVAVIVYFQRADATKTLWLAEAPDRITNQNCKPRPEIVAQLMQRFGEQIVAAGTGFDGPIELWRSRGGRTFSIVIGRRDGLWCPIAWGENWLKR